jgi:hypothetical protein
VEYYIRVIDNFPVAILFRIKKDVSEYEKKLTTFIDCLTNNFDPYKNQKNEMLDAAQNSVQSIENIKDELVDIIIPEYKTKHISDEETISLMPIKDKVTDIIVENETINKYDAKTIIFLITIISVCVSASFYSSYVYMENIDKSNIK